MQNCMQLATSRIQFVAASRMQIVPAWPPAACNINKIDCNLPATGGHTGTICIRLVVAFGKLVIFFSNFKSLVWFMND
jgi:hypothetical protein